MATSSRISSASDDLSRSSRKRNPPIEINDAALFEDGSFSRRAIELLDARKHFKRTPQSRTDVHEAIVLGLPYSALVFFVSNLMVLNEDEVIEAAGISPRTLRRQKETPIKPMPVDLGSRTWMLAEALAKASDVFGGREAAERWMSNPAMGLDGKRPIELLRTIQGAELVDDFLERLKYGVYN